MLNTNHLKPLKDKLHCTLVIHLIPKSPRIIMIITILTLSLPLIGGMIIRTANMFRQVFSYFSDHIRQISRMLPYIFYFTFRHGLRFCLPAKKECHPLPAICKLLAITQKLPTFAHP
jgi:hypothetical protein